MNRLASFPPDLSPCGLWSFSTPAQTPWQLDSGKSGSYQVPECYFCHSWLVEACPRPTQSQRKGKLTLPFDMRSHVCPEAREDIMAIFRNYTLQLSILLWNLESWKNFIVGLWKFMCPVAQWWEQIIKEGILALLPTKLFSRLRANWFYKNNSSF